MSPVELVVLGTGLLVILAGLAWTYRYTASPKAGERMAEADRRYQPPQEPDDVDVDWPLAAKIFGAFFALRLLLLFTEVHWSWIASPSLWTVVVIGLVGWRRKRQRDEAGDPRGFHDGRVQNTERGS